MKLKKKVDPIFTDDYLSTILEEYHDANRFIEDKEEAEAVNDALRLIDEYIDFLLDNNMILSFIASDKVDEQTVEFELEDDLDEKDEKDSTDLLN